MKLSKLTKTVTALIGGLVISGIAQADFVANMSRISADAGGGGVPANTVRNNCGGGTDGFDSASASIQSEQSGGTSQVKIMLKDGTPNTHYTIWVRLAGSDQDSNGFGGSPLTGGGATPLAPSTALDALTADWIGAGSATGANSFTTNHQGKGILMVNLDFPLEGGAYPFNNISAAALADIRTFKNAGALATPTAIVDPRQSGVSGPFLVRMVSHCLDGVGHGLSPAAREPWFQYP